LASRSSGSLLATKLPLLSCLLQLPISVSMDLLLTAGEHVLRRDVTDGWRPSLSARIASVASSCVLSISLMGERLLHSKLNRNKRTEWEGSADF
jgi:hypothetical protein